MRLDKWTDPELQSSIEAYFKMFSHERNSTSYSKAELNRELQKTLPKRNSKSIDRRWRNISAVLVNNGYPFVSGLKPSFHVGSAVEEKIWKIIKELNVLN
jgi:hypothetical protein